MYSTKKPPDRPEANMMGYRVFPFEVVSTQRWCNYLWIWLLAGYLPRIERMVLGMSVLLKR